MTASTWAIVLASGKDEMMDAETCTAFLNLNNKPILSYSLTALEACREIDGVVVVAPRDKLEHVVSVVRLFGCHKVRKIVPGSPLEITSIATAMTHVDRHATSLVFHEASRPGVTAEVFSSVIKTARRQGIALAGHVVTETTAQISKNGDVEVVYQRGTTSLFGTPLAIKRDVLDKVMERAKDKKSVKTLMEGILDVGDKLKVVQVTPFPEKIMDFDQLRASGSAMQAE